MIDRQQLAEALAGLDPRDREVLDYSLRRRVPDEDLAALFQTSAAEVARMRAASVERLSAALGVERGADLGHVLKELLDESMWALVPAAGPSEHEIPAPTPSPVPAEADQPADHRPLGATGNPAPGDGEAEPAPEPDKEPAEGERAPVLGMLSGADATAERPRRAGRRRALIAVAAAIGVLVPAGVVAALTRDGNGAGAARKADPGNGTRPFKTDRRAAEPFPSDPQRANEYPIAYVRGRTTLYDSPNGKVKLKIPGKTEWDSPRLLGVVERRGNWLAVLVPELKNGRRAWIRDDKIARLNSVPYAIHVDLSRRTLTVEKNGTVVRKAKIGVGRVGHSTPVGRYAVTDKLRVSDSISPYGCCVLALTGHQTRLPAGWPGGDRLAIHATRDTSGLGKAVSLGCLRADPRDAKWMLETVPLGTPVFVRQ